MTHVSCSMCLHRDAHVMPCKHSPCTCATHLRNTTSGLQQSIHQRASNLQSREFSQDSPLQHYSRAHGPTGEMRLMMTCRPMSSAVVLQRTILRELPRLKIGHLVLCSCQPVHQMLLLVTLQQSLHCLNICLDKGAHSSPQHMLYCMKPWGAPWSVPCLPSQLPLPLLTLLLSLLPCLFFQAVGLIL